MTCLYFTKVYFWYNLYSDAIYFYKCKWQSRTRYFKLKLKLVPSMEETKCLIILQKTLKYYFSITCAAKNIYFARFFHFILDGLFVFLEDGFYILKCLHKKNQRFEEVCSFIIIQKTLGTFSRLFISISDLYRWPAMSTTTWKRTKWTLFPELSNCIAKKWATLWPNWRTYTCCRTTLFWTLKPSPKSWSLVRTHMYIYIYFLK